MCEEIGADIDYENCRVNMFGPMRHPYPCVSLNIALGNSGVQFGSQGNLFPARLGGGEISPLADDPKWLCWRVVDDNIAKATMEEAMKRPPQSPGMDLNKFMIRWREVLAEEEASGAVVSAPTLEELADKLGFDRADFCSKIADYNENIHTMPDEAPGMPPMDMDDEDGPGAPPPRAPQPRLPISQGPFYALKLKLFHENSVGGMTIDDHASVLRQGKPIPGLYAAGDTTRGIMVSGDVGVDYIEGVFTALTQALNEGYIAGVSAAEYVRA